jgi:hypothetical protein
MAVCTDLHSNECSKTQTRARSVVISKLLDNAGLSPEMVAIRILRFIARDNIYNMIPHKQSIIATGSQAEGIGVSSNELLIGGKSHFDSSAWSDIDQLIILNKRFYSDFSVVLHEDGPMSIDRTSGILHDGVFRSRHHPGYVHIVEIEPVTNQPVELTARFVRNLFYTSPETQRRYARGREIHGPSIETESTTTCSMDSVYCLHMKSWPTDANEWKTRSRKFGWPSPSLVAAVIKRGCHVVPIGHRKSQHRSSEWRLSFSVAERTLV